MDFDTAFTKLIGHEGGYCNDPADKGGETKFGISKRSYPYLAIASLTLSDAKAIYQKDFWNKIQADSLPQEIRFNLFDGAINSGVSQSVKWLQKAVGVTQDGVLGPQTLNACRTIPGGTLAARYNGARLAFMCDLPTFKDFGRGWARRIAANLME